MRFWPRFRRDARPSPAASRHPLPEGEGGARSAAPLPTGEGGPKGRVRGVHPRKAREKRAKNLLHEIDFVVDDVDRASRVAVDPGCGGGAADGFVVEFFVGGAG